MAKVIANAVKAAKIAAKKTAKTRMYNLVKQGQANKQARKMASISQNRAAQQMKRMDNIKQQAIASTIGRTTRSVAQSFTDMGTNIAVAKTNRALGQYNNIINGNSGDSTIESPGSNPIDIEDRG